VHSAKFAEEGQTDNIRQAVLRYEVHHPVVNDRAFTIWQSYGANAWPYVVLIDPEGRIVLTQAGEGVYGRFAEPIKQLIAAYDKKGELNKEPLGLKTEAESAPEEYLAFPGKVLADASGGRLFVSDQNHNRIVICELKSGRVLETIGSGKNGFKDGAFGDAEFNHPQGMALVGSKLYIADTENHAVREADLETKQVTTLAGNGNQALGWGATGGRGRDVALSSPWDIVARDSLLYVAMAGTHQIWTIRLSDGFASPFAGTSQEGRRDGPRQRAALAQPSGLTILGDRLYFADSEVSSVRYVEIGKPDGEVGTVVGLDLFEFGDVDGNGDKVRLQHPLGVTTDGKLLYVADTYNSKIKVIDPEARSCKTLFGSKPGLKDGKGTDSRLYEPGGICYAEGKLYIADTDNHRVRVADLASQELTTLDVNANVNANANEDKGKALKEVMVGVGEGEILFSFKLPEGTKLNPESQVVLSLVDGGQVASAKGAMQVAYTLDKTRQSYGLPVVWKQGAGEVVLDADFVYCGEKDATVCYPGHKRLRLPVKAEGSGSLEAQVIVEAK
jgi:DNA-binding beta-propeller fold protein YncE